MKKLNCLFLFLLVVACRPLSDNKVSVQGELKRWHKITLLIDGPETSEWAKENPFLDFRLQVTFRNGDKEIIIPGFYATDGNAAETSSDSGNKWMVRFRPESAGNWQYSVSFRKGKNIVLNNSESEGEPVGSDGCSGTIEIAATDKSGNDFRGKGWLQYSGSHYLKFSGTNEIWIKNGADSPENFLAYADFDQTSRFSLKTEIREGEADPKKGLHTYAPHLADWKEGDPSWQNGKGKGIIGAVNYLASAGLNSQYMLTMNIMGDGKDVWPWTDHNERYRFDCSKLDQWEIVFDHMEKLGIMAHFVLQEVENQCLLDAGYTDVQRKLYLRELVARFGHHLGITWNLGEENGPAKWSPVGQTEQQKRDMANYLKEVNPYPCFTVLHTHSNDELQDEYLLPLLGFKSLDGPSMQIGNPTRVNERINKFVTASAATKPWVVCLDEIGPSWKGVMPDVADAKHDTIRHYCLWGALMAGGGGVEWYFGYRFPHNDLVLEDFRSRENWWKQSSVANGFFASLPVEEMKADNGIVTPSGSYCFAQPGKIYVIYIPAGTSHATLKLANAGDFSVKWFNPREGGALVNGTVKKISGKGIIRIGLPPAQMNEDWICVIQ